MNPARTGAFLTVLLLALVAVTLHAQSLPPGSLIVPMHTGTGGQNDVLKAYGLVYDLLAHNIPVSWAFSKTKIHGGPDFTAAASQVMDRSITTAVTKSFDYKGGVFIVHLSDTAAAGPIIRQHATDVWVHQVLYTFTSVPIRHTLRHTPRVFIQDHYGPWLQLVTDVFTRANIPPSAYKVDSTGIPTINTLSYQGSGCFTAIAIPHDDGLSATDVYRLKEFADSGGTVYLQCASVLRFESQPWPIGLVFSTDGLEMRPDPTRGYWTHPDSGTHTTLGQFNGTIEACGGTLPAWAPTPGGSYRPNTIPLACLSSDSTMMKAAFARKNGDSTKGLIVCVGGHRFVPTNGSAPLVNLCRVLLNTIFSPVNRRICTPLPVNLVSFTATASGADVLLRWRTDAEVNSLGFEVERRVNMEEQWSRIGFVRCEGTGGGGAVYSFFDRTAAGITSLVSYRLRSIDVDGSYEYSAVETVAPDEVTPTTLAATIYPNPADESFQLRLWTKYDTGITCTVVDMFGRVRARFTDGQSLMAGWHDLALNCADLVPGNYLVTVSGTHGSVTQRLRIVR